MLHKLDIGKEYSTEKAVIVYEGDCLEFLKSIPDRGMQLVVTSPPYNIGKEYEKRLHIDEYVCQQREVIRECVRVLRDEGHICWQVGNYVEKGSIIPLDTILYPIFHELGLRMRNRIIWHFEHGLHCKKRFSGRYETLMWFTRGDEYYFDLDPVRVPQKYPGKRYFKGPKAGQYSCNPLGKNPGDVWVIPNVKSNHVEKTAHPCQFPVELIERLVLCMTRKGDAVFDPFLGVGTTIIAAILHGRRGLGAEVVGEYVETARQRIKAAAQGRLRTRDMNTPVFDPRDAGKRLTDAPWLNGQDARPLFQRAAQGD
jgi:adenine-specific DNA-methyltransferase